MITNSNVQNKSYSFEIDVKNAPLGIKEVKEPIDEDDDSEFRVCAHVDKSNKKAVCENIIVNSPKENLLLWKSRLKIAHFILAVVNSGIGLM